MKHVPMNLLFRFLLIMLLIISVMDSKAQLTIQNRGNNNFGSAGSQELAYEYLENWTGLTPDTIAGGVFADGVIGSTVGTPTILGAAMCGDTLYKVTSFLDVTNNPLISFDAANGTVSSALSDNDGNLEIYYDNAADFLIGEENEITATFDFTMEYDGTVHPLDKGIELSIGNMSGSNPGEVIDYRVYNGLSLVIEENGITNSSYCSPLDPNGTSNNLVHNIIIPVGTTFTRIEIDFWICDNTTQRVVYKIGEFTIPNLSCPVFNGFDHACPEGNSYYAWDWVNYSTASNWRGEVQGWQIGGNAARSKLNRIDDGSYLPDGNYSRIEHNQDKGPDAIELAGFSWSADDRGQAIRVLTDDATQLLEWEFDFRVPISNPILLINNVDRHMPISIEDGYGNPVQVRSAGNTEGMVLYNNIVERFEPNSNGLDGPANILLELTGDFDRLLLKWGPTPQQTSMFEVTIGECLPDINENNSCPFDLYQWKVDSLECEYILKDKDDVFYKMKGTNFFVESPTIDITAFVDAPVAGEVALVQKNAILSDPSCVDGFVCFADGHTEVVRLERSTPNGTGYLLDRIWYDEDNTDGNQTALGGTVFALQETGFGTVGTEWDEPGLGPFDGPLDALGLVSHGVNGVASGIVPTYPDAQLGEMGIFVDNFGPLNAMCDRGNLDDVLNLQQDGWLAIPPGLNCMEFITNDRNGRFISFNVIESDGTVVQVLEENRRDGNHNGDYCINNPHAVFGGGWQLLRVRVYAHILDCTRNQLFWHVANSSINNPFSSNNTTGARDMQSIATYLYPADSPESLNLPPVLEQVPSEIQYALKDAEGNYWEPNGTDIPTTLIDFDVDLRNHITDITVTDCAGQPDNTTGATCAEAFVSLPCDPVETCEDAENHPLDVCEIIAQDPASPLATEDCDGGGVDNATECAQGFDPTEGSDDAIPTCDPSTPAPTVNGN